MEHEHKTQLSLGTWIGIVGLVVTLLTLQRMDVHYLGSRIDSAISELRAEMRDIHGRMSAVEVERKG